MYNSFIEILSPGELLRPLVIKEIIKDEYIPETRNKIIAGILNNLGIMDKRGTGFLRIRDALDKWNMPHPEFEERQGWFIIRFRNPNVEKIPTLDEIKLSDRQNNAIKYIKTKGKITTKEYMKINNISERTARNDIEDLVKKTVLEKIGTTRASYYIIRNSAIFGNIRQKVIASD